MLELKMVEEDGVKMVEGEPGAPFMTKAGDVDRVVEACFSDRAGAALLYADNLPPAFFDLSSRDAGAILQKLRNYHIRLAVVVPPGSVQFSSHFGEMVEEEKRGREFGVFKSREAAREWLAQ
jgi:hypothetical protein